MNKINWKGLPTLIVAASLAACSGSSGTSDALETEVLAIHDEVMPKMEDIVTNKTRLQKKIAELDSLQQEGVGGTSLAEQRLKAYDLIHQLDAADSLMMDWMFYYNADSAKTLSSEQAISYFENERKKILDVKDRTLKGLEESRLFLDKQ